MTINPRLAHLLELADKGPALRAALAEEAAALLIEWPDDCPIEMRPVFENLLAKTVREVDSATRARLRVRLYADRALCARVLPREDAITPLICAAREGDAVVPQLAQTLGLDEDRATQILNEDTGEALAIACKGAGLSRAAYSTLDAARTLRSWRGVALPQAAE